MNWKESLARDIYNWCKQHGLWGDNTIYFDGKAWASDRRAWQGQLPNQIDEDLFEYADRDPRNYFEYANPDTVSMSFEGPLWAVLNGDVLGWVELEAEFLALFEKYGMYYELGNSWNLSCYQVYAPEENPVILYEHASEPYVMKTFNIRKAWKNSGQIFGCHRSFEEYKRLQIEKFKSDLEKGFILFYEVID